MILINQGFEHSNLGKGNKFIMKNVLDGSL